MKSYISLFALCVVLALLTACRNGNNGSYYPSRIVTEPAVEVQEEVIVTEENGRPIDKEDLEEAELVDVMENK